MIGIVDRHSSCESGDAGGSIAPVLFSRLDLGGTAIQVTRIAKLTFPLSRGEPLRRSLRSEHWRCSTRLKR